VTLDRVRDLFGPPALDEFGGSADVASGIERLGVRLQARRPRGGLRVAIEVPEAEAVPGLEDTMRAAVRRYCQLKLTDLENQRAALRHEGWSALLVSVPLLVVTLVVTALVTNTGGGDAWDSILGDGLLLVFAWVVLWYPLDTLLWYGRPLKHEIAAVRAMLDMDLVVRAETGPVGPGATTDGSAARGGEVDPGRPVEPATRRRADPTADPDGRRGAPGRRFGGPGRNRAGS